MKALNNIKFICEATTTFNSWVDRIDSAVDYEEARRFGSAAIGFADCMIVYLNAMVSTENNDFTAELDEMIEAWQYTVYQHMASKAIETRQDSNTVIAMLRMRDAHAA